MAPSSDASEAPAGMGGAAPPFAAGLTRLHLGKWGGECKGYVRTGWGLGSSFIFFAIR